MKILHTVQYYYPSVGGMQEVVRQLSERLAAKGHDVTVATSYDENRENELVKGVKIKQFDISGNWVEGYKGNVKSYQNYLTSSRFDIMTNFAAQQWATDLTLPILPYISSKKVFVPTGFSALNQLSYHQYFAHMAKWMKQYDMNIFLSFVYQDIRFAINHGIGNWIMIPNGASQEEFLKVPRTNIRKELSIPASNLLILNVSSHMKDKGHKEAISIFNKANVKDAILLIVGNGTEGGCYSECLRKEKLYNFLFKMKKNRKRIIIAFLSREKTVAAYQEADLFLFPSQIECSPIVLFECLASKTPFLASNAGNTEEIVKWSKNGEILPGIKKKNGYISVDVNKSARILENSIKNANKNRKMAERGYEIWKKKYTWEGISKKYEDLYKKLLK